MSALLDQPFHAPVSSDLIDILVGQCETAKERCRELADINTGDKYRDAVGYFLRANPDQYQRTSRQCAEVFDLGPTLKYINSVFWKQALDLTDVFECMPQARKDEWNESIQKRETPEFTDDNVRATLGDLMLSRTRFIAEKADGVFRRLSREHVTNVPEGFGKRFIMDYCFGYGSAAMSAAGYLSDLREIIAKYMGRPLPEGRMNSHSVMHWARTWRRGEWVDLDGGALKIRCYLKGTMHIEVHPDIAWRLNQLLHQLYPAAIPSRFRNAPKKTKKIPAVHDRPLSFECLRLLQDGIKRAGTQEWGTYGNYGKAVAKEANAVLEQIGGVRDNGTWRFDYCPHDVLHEIVASGVVPDKISHQFYPTPAHIAEAMIKEAGIDPGQHVLEPSAGTGSIAEMIPTGTYLTCVEISELHCKVLESKLLAPDQAEFLEWARKQNAMLDVDEAKYDRIVMNPPYSEGRALAHLESALTLLAPDGRLVALLPATYQNRDMPGNGRWAQTFDRFPGTSISVAIYVVEGR